MSNPVEMILKKRDGHELSTEEITAFIDGFLDGSIPPYQMSALLMAIYFRDMTPPEIQTLTERYIASGERVIFADGLQTVDKHSTGGVGDKVSIVLGPLAAACGLTVPMISGRGLGHTGGTLDKLETIPGLRTDLDIPAFKQVIEQCGFSIVSQSDRLVPADGRIYGLRDVTGTVESLPLITASIMSKKIAEGARNLIIDLKVGRGAFMETLEHARKLGRLLADTGERLGQRVGILYTRMNAPIGRFVGNALEVAESIYYLKGQGEPDLDRIVRALVEQMLIISGKSDTREEAARRIDEAIVSGAALERFTRFIEAQDGDPRVVENPDSITSVQYAIPVRSPGTGWITGIDSRSIGYALIGVGAGRRKIADVIVPAAGAELPCKIGHRVKEGETIGTVYCDDSPAGEEAARRISGCYRIVPEEVPAESEIIGGEGRISGWPELPES